MNDPHVETLRYHLRTDENISYKEDTPSVEYETSTFKATLAKNVLVMTMKKHFATPVEATNRVYPDLMSWEVLTGVQLGPGHLGFEYKDAEVIDRTPLPPGGGPVNLSADLKGSSHFGPVTMQLVRSHYPTPPNQFMADSTVEVLWNRYTRYTKGGEPLTGMGYFCLSVIQADAGGRRQAVAKYVVNKDVLDKFGELTSEAGDESEARKLDAGSTFAPLTDKQRTWIDAAVRKLILRAGEYAANPTGSHPEIKMADLPAL